MPDSSPKPGIRYFTDYLQSLLPNDKLDFQPIAHEWQTRQVAKGDYLFRAGETCHQAAFVVRGCVRVFLLHAGKEASFLFQYEGRFASDYDSYFRQEPTPFWFQAVETTEVLLLNKACTDYLFEVLPQGQRLQRRIVESYFSLFRARLLSLYLDNPAQRYERLLAEEPQLLQRIPQYYLASYLGIEPQSLSRLKKRLHAAGRS